MISRETINDVATAVLLSDIIDFIPMKAQVKRKTIEGMIQKNLPKRSQDKLDISKYLNFEHNNEVVSRFVEILEQDFSHCDLQSLYKNIQTLKIVERDKSIGDRLEEILTLRGEAAGSYSPRKNKITTYSEKNYNELLGTKVHELVHFATTRKVGNATLCGFSISKNKILFGDGLNEGYTEWFTQRYLLKEKGGSYKELQSVAALIEEIIGPEKMQQYFFTNNLNGLVNDMEKYTTRQNVLALLEKMDRIKKWGGKPGGKTYREKLAREARVDLANIILTKHQKMLAEGTMSEQQYKNSLFFLEVYTHGLREKFYGKDENHLEIATIEGHIDGICQAEISYDEYNQLKDKYYELKKSNPKFTYETWTDQDGLTIEQSFKKIETEKKQAELNQMLAEQNANAVSETTTLKSW